MGSRDARPSVRLRISFRKVGIAVLVLPLILASIKTVAAQPGDQRTPEQIKRDLDKRLEEAHENINRDLAYGPSYTIRGEVYAEFSWRASDPNDKTGYFEKALEDFNTAIVIGPGDWISLAKRAELRYRADLFGNFDAIVADYKEAIRLAKRSLRRDPNPSSGYDSPVPNYYRALAGVYLNRAEAFMKDSKSSPSGSGQVVGYSPWEDFDLAISYTQKAVQKPMDLDAVVNVSMRKGDAAFLKGEDDIALDSYRGDKKYLGENYKLLCEDNEDPQSYCADQQRTLATMFSLRRAKVYVRQREPEKALTELDVYFKKAYHFDCAQPFLLRAQANRLLYRIDLALKDEQTAARKSGNSSSCSL